MRGPDDASRAAGKTEPAPAELEHPADDGDTLADAPRRANEAMASPDLGEITLDVCAVSDVGSVRSNNEDAYAVIDRPTGQTIEIPLTGARLDASHGGVLLAVADGMGGENAGEVASALVLESLRRHLCEPSEIDHAPALSRAVESANREVLEAATQPGRHGMGATLIAVLVCGDAAYTAEVGDSRAYLFRGTSLKQLTTDQTQAQMLIDSGFLTPEAAKQSRAKSVVLQACGTVTEVIVAQRRIALRHGDRLLLCSDGLTTHVSNVEIEEVLGTSSPLHQACSRLLMLALERGGQDNVTLLLAEVAGAPGPVDGEVLEDTLETLRAFSVAGDA